MSFQHASKHIITPLQCIGQHTLCDCVCSCSLLPHLLVDVNNADEKKEDHYKIIQRAQHTAQRPRKSLQRGGQGHGSAKSTNSHPQEKEPHQAAHVPQPSHQQEQEERCVTQVVFYLERKRQQSNCIIWPSTWDISV